MNTHLLFTTLFSLEEILKPINAVYLIAFALLLILLIEFVSRITRTEEIDITGEIVEFSTHPIYSYAPYNFITSETGFNSPVIIPINVHFLKLKTAASTEEEIEVPPDVIKDDLAHRLSKVGSKIKIHCKRYIWNKETLAMSISL